MGKPWTLQQEYEMNLHGLWETIKVSEMVALKLEVQRQQAIHGDYKGWYHREDIARYTRIARQSDEMNVASRGSNPPSARRVRSARSEGTSCSQNSPHNIQ